MKTITVYDREDFRKWLEKNHDKETRVALVLYKKHTGKKSPSHRELMEEAICFGWIDTTINRLDEDRYVRNFSRRNKNSKWSDNTLSYAKDLIKRGLMTPIGLKFYNEGKNKPTHDHGIPKNPDMPFELENALKKSGVLEKFNSFSPSTKRMIYRWILRGKLKETRDKRVGVVVSRVKEGRKDAFGTQERVNN